jgi:hypothetical protein
MRGTTLLTALLLAASGVHAKYNLYIYSDWDYTGTQKEYTTTGTYSLGFTARSWHFTNIGAPALCVNFFHGSTNTGYSCAESDGDKVVAPEYQFNKVVVSEG